MSKRQPKKVVTVRWSSFAKKEGRRACWYAGVCSFTLKVHAINYGRWLANHYKAELVVKNKDGRIAWRNSYGNDPRSRKG